jgi:MOSC domain-containing protein YiiM
LFQGGIEFLSRSSQTLESEVLVFEGRLEAIYVGPKKGSELQRVAEAHAITGCGLAGDRYCGEQGPSAKPIAPERQITLIEMEAIEALAHECEITLQAGQARRSLVTRGVPLNHLVGAEFQVGDVILRGIRLCEPCGHLESLTVPGIMKGLCHRGGLRAQIVRGGLLRSGDVIRPGVAQGE